MKLIVTVFITKILNDEIDISSLLSTLNDFNPKSNIDIQILKDNIVKRLRERPKSSIHKLFKLLNLSEKDIFQKEVIQFKEYNIFGCPLSTDIDIAFIVDDPEIILKYKQNLIILDVDNVLDEIRRYYPHKEFDLNLITIDSHKNLLMAYKGSKETQNIIYHTYKYHIQRYPLFFDKEVIVDLNDKIRSLAVFVLDYLHDIIGEDEYKKQREIKRRIYSDPSERIKYVNEILSNMVVTIDKNIVKAITMKLIQIILLNENIYAYTKQEMVDLLQEYFNENIDENIDENMDIELWNLLTRDKFHIESDIAKKQNVFELLVKKYLEIYLDMISSFQWTEIYIDFDTNPTELDDLIVREFIKSPLIPTEKFMESAKYIMDDNINKYFVLNTYGEEYLPGELHKYIIFEPQRSERWMEYHREFTKDKVKNEGNKYSMIRGALGEMFITTYDFSEICGELVNKCMIGFIKEGENLCAPDLLLINDEKEIIPVEIKCLPMDVCFDMNNMAFHREFKLARKQIKYITEIIDNIYDKKVKKGIIIFAYFTQEYIKTFYTIVDM